jgi:ribosome-associated protein
MDTEKLLKLILDIAEEFKAEDIKVLQVTDHCDFADYFVFMCGRSTTQVKSIAEELHFRSKHAGNPPHGEEGMDGGEWCLLDYGSIVVHVFLPQKRAYYNLEELCQEAPTAYPAPEQASE